MRSLLLLGMLGLCSITATGQGVSPKGVNMPAVVKAVKAVYTPEARAAGIEGTVFVDVVVQTDGTVGDEIKVVQSLDTAFGLDAEAVKASRQWKFRPAKKAGTAVAMRITLEHAFKLEP
jgi:periplasmic protein TonB